MLEGHRVNLDGWLVGTLAAVVVGALGCGSPSSSAPKAPNCAARHVDLRKPEVGPDEPVERALELERGCSAGRTGDCWSLKSSMTFIGQCAGAADGVAREFLDRACDARSAEACLQRAGIVGSAWFHSSIQPTPARVKDDLRRAFPFYERACDVGHPHACAYVGWMTRDGIGTSPDPARGNEILERGCDRFRRTGSRLGEVGIACSHLARSYADGRGVRADWAKARELNHAFCGDDLDCDELYLVSSETARVGLWAIELLLVVLANVVALLAFLPQFRERWLDERGFGLRIVAAAGVLGSLAVAVELAYFFWGSRVSSPLWLFVAVPLCTLPLVVGFGRPRAAA
jgi:hypothetical protein